MNTDARNSPSKQISIAFFISLVFYLVVYFLASNCATSFFCALLQADEVMGSTITGGLSVSYDSRIFLLPLQRIMQVLLRLIPFFQSGNSAAVFLAIIFSSAISSLIVRTAENADIPAFLRWITMAAYLFNPWTVTTAISGSGVSILAFFLLIVFSYISRWQKERDWLALVWIGFGTALAVITQFTSLFFIFLPILAALIIAFREHPNNVYFTENALWIMLTPLLYVLMIRIFFGRMLTGDPFAFYHFEVDAMRPAPDRQLVDLPFLYRMVNFLAGQIAFICRSYPPFAIISAITTLLAVVKRKIFPFVYMLMFWFPLLIFPSTKQVGIYDPESITILMAIVSAIMIAINTSTQLKKTKTGYLIVICLLILAWNVMGLVA